MRPIAEIPESVLRRLAGVVFDVDDTLTTHGRLHTHALDALWSLHRAGLALVAVTGRPLGWADVMAATWPIDLAIGENGAGWSRRREGALALGYFDDEATRARHAELLACVRRAVREALPDVKIASDQAGRRCDLAFDVGEGEALARETIDELVSVIEASGARALISSVHAHVVPGEWDKARGVMRALPEALGAPFEADRWIFVGDSGNDAAAFEAFELTVGVANVREHLHRLPTPPRWITREERGAGFAELARHIVLARAGHE